MANILAAQSGNFNSTSTWTGGVVPSTGDVAIANNYTITITANATCSQIRNDATGGAATGINGRFYLNGGVTLTADVTPSGVSNYSTLYFSSTSYSDDSTIIGNITSAGSSSNNSAITHNSNGTLRINGNLTGGNTNSSQYAVLMTGRGNLIITGNVTGGGQTSHGISHYAGTITITGNLYGGLSSSSGSALYANGSGTINIYGNLYSSGLVPGSQTNSQAITIDTSSGSTTINITGDVIGGWNTNEAIRVNGFCTINITGNVYGPAAVSSGSASIMIGTVCTINVTGTVTGGYAAAISNNSAGTINVNGSVIGGALGGHGIVNGSTGTVYVKRAIGSGFGLGSSAAQSYGVVNSGTGSAYVQEIQYGALGQSPTSGRIYLTDLSTNVCLFYKGTGQKTLIDPLSTSGYVPSPSDVRIGIPYSKNSTGTMSVPNKGSVDYGVSVDNTLGTACLSPQSMLNHGTVNMNVPGSIGERVKNAATVATCGQQIADSLRDI